MSWRKFAPKVTKSEYHLHHALNKEGIAFISQEHIRTRSRSYLVDFLVTPNIVVEVDGASHLKTCTQAKDAFKDQELHDLGFLVLRFTDWQIWHELPQVIQQIKEAIK